MLGLQWFRMAGGMKGRLQGRSGFHAATAVPSRPAAVPDGSRDDKPPLQNGGRVGHYLTLFLEVCKAS